MNARRQRTICRGFTLTELLVVIMVISVLASSLLFAMYNAVQQAKEARTKAQIAKLHELLMTRWDSYRTRAIRLNIAAAARGDTRTVALARLLAIRDLMRLELPDRKSDVLDNPIGDITTSTPGGTFTVSWNYSYTRPTSAGPKTFSGPVSVGITLPACAREYRRRVVNLDPNTPKTLAGGAAIWTETYQDSECLYMIIASMQDIVSNGLDFLHESEVGDTDKDGMPEILDAWGNPIAFIRWAPGFLEHPDSDFIFGSTGTIPDIPSYSNLQVADPTASPDPFDPLRLDRRTAVNMNSVGTAQYQFGFALYPLIVSGGPDELLDIVRFDYDPSTPSVQVAFDYYRILTNPYLPTGWTGPWPNDPYSVMPTCNRRLGEPFLDSDGYKDNITNQGLGE